MNRTIKADDGYVFCNLDKTIIYNSEIHLAVNESVDNFMQITTAEAEEIKAEIERKLIEEEDARRTESESYSFLH